MTRWSNQVVPTTQTRHSRFRKSKSAPGGACGNRPGAKIGECTKTTAADHKAWSPALPESRTADLLGHVVERGVGIGADRRNGGQAHDDDQRQHNGVFHRGRAIFRNQETLHLQSKILHCFLRGMAPARSHERPSHHIKLSPPGTATRTSRRPASHRNETQTSIARLVISQSLTSSAITLAT